MLMWQNPRNNHLLYKLPESAYLRLEPGFELVSLQGGQLLIEADTTPVWGYFPVNCLLSMVGGSSEGQYTPIADQDCTECYLSPSSQH